LFFRQAQVLPPPHLLRILKTARGPQHHIWLDRNRFQVYSSDVLHRMSFVPRARLIAVILMTPTLGLLADDPGNSQNTDGYKTVPVSVDNKTLPIRVQQQPDPLAHASYTDELDHQSAFSATNPMANKSFLMPSNNASQSISDYKNRDQNTFVTKSYSFDSSAPTAPNLEAKPTFPTTSAYSRSASGFDKNYATSSADTGQKQAALFASATSSDQGRTAVLGGQTTTTFAYPLSDEVFHGDEADAAKRHLSRTKTGQIMVEELPDRPMTIDEVRDLINHGFKPDTEVKPEGEASKPLNDPNYQPEPLRETPPPSSGSDDDKDDPVPPPGTIAAPPAPENSQPLPQP
jgi:hypothetical protein